MATGKATAGGLLAAAAGAGLVWTFTPGAEERHVAQWVMEERAAGTNILHVEWGSSIECPPAPNEDAQWLEETRDGEAWEQHVPDAQGRYSLHSPEPATTVLRCCAEGLGPDGQPTVRCDGDPLLVYLEEPRFLAALMAGALLLAGLRAQR